MGSDRFPGNIVDLVDALKIVYGSEQKSNTPLQEAVVFLAPELAKLMKKHGYEVDSTAQVFDDILASAGSFIWDMVTLGFEKVWYAFDCYDHEQVVPSSRRLRYCA